MSEYDTFYRMHSKVHGLYSKNIELEKECMKMEHDIGKYQQEMKALILNDDVKKIGSLTDANPVFLE